MKRKRLEPSALSPLETLEGRMLMSIGLSPQGVQSHAAYYAAMGANGANTPASGQVHTFRLGLRHGAGLGMWNQMFSLSPMGVPGGMSPMPGNSSSTSPTATLTTATNPSGVLNAATMLPIAPGALGQPGGPVMWAPNPLGPLGHITLTSAEVASLKQTVDTFASSYTSGTDATKDKAAVAALESGLQSLARNVWSEKHVVDSATVAKLQAAVDSFATSYTHGADAGKDSTAWQSLQSGLVDFAKSVMTAGKAAAGQSSTSASTTTANDPPPAPPLFLGAFGSHGVSISSTGEAPTGLLDNITLTKDEVTSIQTAVDTFATSYTSGTDATKDKAATDALQKSLEGVFASHFNTSTTGAVGVSGQVAQGHGPGWRGRAMIFRPRANGVPGGTIAMTSAKAGGSNGGPGWTTFGPGGLA